jgi:hypothetical protein
MNNFTGQISPLEKALLLRFTVYLVTSYEYRTFRLTLVFFEASQLIKSSKESISGRISKIVEVLDGDSGRRMLATVQLAALVCAARRFG